MTSTIELIYGFNSIDWNGSTTLIVFLRRIHFDMLDIGAFYKVSMLDIIVKMLFPSVRWPI